ncbi:MAG TPA: response regulator [Candidatus Angelobacter sp.]|jgi:CheY-like chemotaxis protein|nr:response regulator [Candidatus Angelobacter sp.]
MHSKLSMLIVDDEPNVCFTLKLIFEKEGFSVFSAGSAAEGMEILSSKEKFDVVLTDLHMEKEDAGLELARKAKQLEPPPVLVVLTGYASMHNVRAALDLHVDHFAIKPMELTELLEAVRRLAGWRIDARAAGS